RLIVEREREIENFVPEEYWSIHAEFLPDGHQKGDTFIAKLHRFDGEEPALNSEEDVQPLLSDMETADYVTTLAKKGTRKRNP
ncbi:MAG: DNA topoisomerase I, partial [candidate division Zixibacteria bacterium]|nr:DNA topoisomerase I [candidate division Zixibacteria bacterium]NIW50283.1 DNA topoisomerase I [Gammaproteobacteria bacterium]